MSSTAKIQLIIDADSRRAEGNLRQVQAEASKTAEQVSKLDAASNARYLEKFDDASGVLRMPPGCSVPRWMSSNGSNRCCNRRSSV